MRVRQSWIKIVIASIISLGIVPTTTILNAETAHAALSLGGSISTGTYDTATVLTYSFGVDMTNVNYLNGAITDTVTITAVADTRTAALFPLIGLSAVSNESGTSTPIVFSSNSVNFTNPLVITISGWTASSGVIAYSNDGTTWNTISETTTASPTLSSTGVRETFYKVNSTLVKIYTLHLTTFGARETGTVSISSSTSAMTVNDTRALTVTASDTGTVSYTSSTTSICTVSGSTLTAVAAGTCTLSAYKAQANQYTDATSANVSITINAASSGGGAAAPLQTQPSFAITPPAKSDKGKTINLSSTGGASGGTITYSGGTPGVCSVTSAGVVTTIGAGTCSITATKDVSGYASVTSTITLIVEDFAVAEAAKAAAAAAEAAKARAVAAIAIISKNRKSMTFDLPDVYANQIVEIRQVMVVKKGKKKVNVYDNLDWLVLGDQGEGKTVFDTKPPKGAKIQFLIDGKVVKTISVA